MNQSIWNRLCLLLLIALLVFSVSACDDDDDDNTGQPSDDDDSVDDDDSTDDDDTVDDDDATVSDNSVELARDVARTWMDTFEPHQNAWSWDSGVMMMGFMSENGSEIFGQEFRDYAQEWIDHFLAEGFQVVSSDTSIPGYICLLLYEQTGDQKYLDAADKVWEYISEQAGRTSEGGLNHMGWISGNQIWVDTLFMVGPFLMKYAEITGSDAPYEEIALQLQVFRRHLRDAETGLYRHRYDDDTGELAPSEPLYWGRGNGWVFVASALANNLLPDHIKAEMDYDIESDLRAMFETLKAQETDGGRFHTIVNRTDTYLETSASLLYAYAVALDANGAQTLSDHGEWIDKWVKGGMDQIVVDDAGNSLLLGTSCGTSPGGVEYYDQVLKVENVSYGIGLYLLAAMARMDVPGIAPLADPPGTSDETYIEPPVPCEGTDCGIYHFMRGNYDAAKIALADGIEEDTNDGEARFIDALTDLIRMVFGLIAQIDDVYIGNTTIGDLLDWVAEDGRNAAMGASAHYELIEGNGDFSMILDRILMIENGGHSAVGMREYDMGEVYLLDGISNLVTGIATLYSDAPTFFAALPDSTLGVVTFVNSKPWKSMPSGETKGIKDGLGYLITGFDKLLLAIDSIMAETDDQSDDLIPANLLQLSGTFIIPGVLPETDVQQLLVDAGIPQFLLNMLDMPDDLVWLLETVRGWLQSAYDSLP